MPPPPPPIRDCVVRRILRLLDSDSARQARLAYAQCRRCFDAQWPGGECKDLWNVATLVDVSPYARVHTVSLFNCSGLTDVSALGAVHTLILYNCPGVTDVASLGAVHTLKLYHCANITDVSALGAVHTLELNNSPGVTDVSSLATLHTLKLYNYLRVPTAQIAALRSHGVNVVVRPFNPLK